MKNTTVNLAQREPVGPYENLYYAAVAGFEAARQVNLLPKRHRSRSLHGHSFLGKVLVARGEQWADFPGDEVRGLQERLRAAVAPLDYSFLNRKVLQEPTDENLARWIRKFVGLEGVHNVGIQSTTDEGVDLDENAHAHFWRRYRFQSAHQLPNTPPGHKCGVMHGHGFEVTLHAKQNLQDNDTGVDYDHLDEIWAPIHAELDHTCLNDIRGLENPTSELIASWIWRRLKPELPGLSYVTVCETASCGAHFDGNHFRIWKELTLDSALQLKRAPQGDPRRRIHGHTYMLRLHLSAPLDDVMGWTIDFGDVKDIFTPIFNRLDHQCLHEIQDLEHNDTASVARWIRGKTKNTLPQLDRIDLYETRGCGAILVWGDSNGPAVPI